MSAEVVALSNEKGTVGTISSDQPRSTAVESRAHRP